MSNQEKSSDPSLKVGGEALRDALNSIDVSAEIQKLRKTIPATKSVAKKDALIKKLKYLIGLSKNGDHIGDAVTLNYVPVAPPSVRPALPLTSNSIEFSDVNHLYRDHMLVNDALKETKDYLPDEDLVALRKSNYDGVKAIFGLGEAISPQSKGKDLRGFMKMIAGEGGPKSGFFHSKVLSKKQDFSGRATIYAEPNLGFNEVAVPKDMLWSMYKYHILRDLAKSGYDHVSGEEAWKKRTPAATAAFSRSIAAVPLIMNRAPTLMKSNVTAAFPVPIEGSTVGLNILHLPLFAGDYDGDALSFHVPMTPEAVQEATKKLLPSTQIFDSRFGVGQSLIAPGHEAVIGAYHLTEPDMTQPVQNFKTEQDAMTALKEGKISENTPIEIGA